MSQSNLTTARFRIPLHPFHFGRTFLLQRLGRNDPTASHHANHFAKAFFYRDEPAAVEFTRDDAEHILVTAHGPHAEALAAETERCLAQDDGYHSFTTPDTGVLRLHWRFAGLRILRFPWLWDTANSVILQQRIRTLDAVKGWQRVARRWGSPAPLGLIAYPPPATLERVARFELEALDIDHQRAQTMLRFAQESRFHPMHSEMDFAALREHLMRQPGIGPWTTESVLGFGAGDVDATIVGDLHLPHLVSYALAGEIRGSDERMLELLEPFNGHRFRIIRLLYASGLAVPRQ